MKKFSEIEKPRRGALAHQAWLILIGMARNWQVTTCERLASIVGQGQTPYTLGVNVLGPISFCCEQHDLPPLTALVLNKHTAKPGGGFPSYGDRAHLLVDVFERDWYALVPPTPEELETAVKEAG